MFNMAEKCTLLKISSVVILIPLFYSIQSEAVQIECKTSIDLMMNKCDVGLTSLTSSVTVVTQDPQSHCVLNTNYWLVLDGANSYLWLSLGCSGVFEVTTPPTWASWGPWGECSVSCGVGTKTRTRDCNTGHDDDCSGGGGTGSMSEDCDLGSCTTETTTAAQRPPLCGFSPTGFRVLGGRSAKDCQFPWMAMTYNPGTKNRCGGSIVDERHIVTAAHCFSTYNATLNRFVTDVPENLVVFTGTSEMPIEKDPTTIPGLVQRQIAKLVMHEGFSDFTLANDIAVITLTEPIVYDQCHVPVCMVNDGMSVYEATDCGTMGWGVTTNSVAAQYNSSLQWTSLNVVTQEVCRRTYGMFYQPKGFCAGGDGHDSCEGDSGGPIVCKGPGNRFYLFGIVSNGLQYFCGIYPGQYTNVEMYLPWLQKHLA